MPMYSPGPYPYPYAYPYPFHELLPRPLYSSIGRGPKGEKGEKGSSFTYDDFTDEDLEDLVSRLSSHFYRKSDATYVTPSDSPVSVIAIPFDNLTGADVVLVDVNGLMLTEGVDYATSNGTIVLTTPITHVGTPVNFHLLRMVGQGGSGEGGGSMDDASYQQIMAILGTKANISSPALSGIPTAPTPITGTDNNQIATTKFVNRSITASVGPIPMSRLESLVNGTSA